MNPHGAACGFFDRRQPVSAFTVHRAAYRIMAALREVGEEALYVQCDGSIPGAERWLRRLGFAPMDDNPTVWCLVLLAALMASPYGARGWSGISSTLCFAMA
ncbi:hypothetical protein ACSBOB_11460 [Mesorhizobium sp. ASY16-5R]|uniref:hypothetical protein n=1 Tax=Mesorhizobium sp. ASY16-5R TaxID=3445772 RepID=UPI003F9F55E3